MAQIETPKVPGKTDPFGNGTLVNDVLSPWPYEDTDPFLLLHELGPRWIQKGMKQGGRQTIHPHRGFCEVPYMKSGHTISLDHWNPDGGHHPDRRSGCLQWGKCGRGIQHGMKTDGTFEGMAHNFQLWVNLPAKEKMDPPCFQDALPEALPWRELSADARVKTLVGQGSPVDTGSIQVQYLDIEVKARGKVAPCIPPNFSTAFGYVYAGAGSFGSTHQSVQQGQVFRVKEPAGRELIVHADQNVDVGCLLMAGVPLKEPCVQHGPFVMSTREQVQQAFKDYQRGELCPPVCDYILHLESGSEHKRCGGRM
eukprot:gnl/TRDRNA2_/TRDRNA2_62225_c0_seq1.p1 gnl/TRDRNA2_/TRDRNA2_62225_c0~~gnl/TRDRNA2_/TRDRNA2_62225_c0_seq1.p1  ORF type:complete len:310 (-),score=30.84 gnl/TRDRNA2_/TRDRNA2_62225_c0_seq1:232-1161(-)